MTAGAQTGATNAEIEAAGNARAAFLAVQGGAKRSKDIIAFNAQFLVPPGSRIASGEVVAAIEWLAIFADQCLPKQVIVDEKVGIVRTWLEVKR